MTTRRNFIKKTSLGGAAFTLLPGVGYSNIFGANERINVAVVGVHSRAKALIGGINAYSNAKIIYSCDVDSEILKEHSTWCQENIGYIPKEEKDFRKMLEDKDVDAVFIATPDHWHAPMAIMALQAGKHVYVEKPCSHSPYENDVLVAAQKRYGKKVQMGNQTRASSQHKLAVEEINDGIIGKVYKGEAYYTNNRPSIGKGKIIEVPKTLDWDLWQGPAPREDYKDNIHPYNWHWFRKWGTGEVANNGLHEIDILRWALGVDLPKSVTSFGGKYTYDDDWEFPDNQEVTYQFDNDKLITYKGHSRGKIVVPDQPEAIVYGSKGAIIFGSNDYTVHDLDGNLVKGKNEIDKMDSTDTMGGGSTTVLHVANFFDAISKNEVLNSPIVDGAISTMLTHYGNIAQFTGRTIRIDQSTGKIVEDAEAMSHWKREYAEGWEPKL
ncbi:Gfo/Idh/MocA family protein [Salegentibacter flavus]|uniref:Tat (Twin-arginine translocation) pathway signal sequence n=1 Tax=Salegentibacter flavus TaxID=287099 RepID=A0A1I5CT60_9FLAO|nr:Gfo/Idh/MocA family oxidoreductase [Salegentibacter flavus]SFN90107.1 Tat (twin-arginine translocation) pathway signal sequence [Salegentibacter flavus]